MYQRIIGSVALTVLALMPAAVSAQSTATGIRVAAHSTIAGWFSTASVDAAFAEATVALRNDAGTHDHSCPITLLRSDAIQTTPYTNGIIDSSQKYNDLISLTMGASLGSMIVVMPGALHYCSSTPGPFGPWGGCGAPVGGHMPFVIDVDWIRNSGELSPDSPTKTQRGNLLAHEFAHTKGLHHKDNITVNGAITYLSSQLMTGADLLSLNSRLYDCSQCDTIRWHVGYPGWGFIWSYADSAQQCTNPKISTLQSWRSGSRTCSASSPSAPLHDRTFRSGSRSVWAHSASSATRTETITHSRAAESPGNPYANVRLRDLARTMLIADSLPTDLSEHYSAEESRELWPLLEDPAYRARHRTIVAVLGLTAAGTPEDVATISSYLRTPGADSAAAGMALGYLVARNGSPEALDTLLMLWQSQNEELGRAAGLGLGLSGAPRALEALRKAGTGAYREKNAISALIDANVAIKQRGLKRYYARQE